MISSSQKLQGAVVDWVVPPKRYNQVLNPGSCELTLFGNKVISDVIKLGCGHNESGYALIQWLKSL